MDGFNPAKGRFLTQYLRARSGTRAMALRGQSAAAGRPARRVEPGAAAMAPLVLPSRRLSTPPIGTDATGRGERRDR